MTKEEILDRQFDNGCNGVTTTGHYRYGAFDCRIIHAAMDEYAKQQAIAFFKFCLPGTDFEPHISKRYDQFIEQ